MKKVFPILIVLFIFALASQYIIIFFVSSHNIDYSVSNDENTYMINENFNYKHGKSYYDFRVFDDDDVYFTFSFNEEFNKQREVIKDIKSFSTKDLRCLFPIYKETHNDDYVGHLSCIYDNKQVDYSYLKQINNYDIGLITNRLIDMGYSHTAWKDTKEVLKPIDATTSFYYKQDDLEDYYFTMWNYKGLSIINDKKATYHEYLTEGQYDNKNSSMVNNYYVTVEDKKDNPNITYFFIYNVRDSGKGTIYLDKGVEISRDYYYNGAYKSDLYITDRKYKKQYAISPTKMTVKEVGNEKDGFKFLHDLKLSTVSADKFLKEDRIFNEIDVPKLKRFKPTKIVRDESYYYFSTEDGSLYRSNINNVTRPVLLLKFDKISDWKVKTGDVVLLVDNTMYFYNEAIGLRKIAVNNEFRYNSLNMIDFYKK